jgi:anti-anti-sigma factor
MQYQQKTEGASIIFEVLGSLSGTASSTIQLFERMTVAVDQKPEEIVIDMQKVTYLDSMSLGLVIGVLLKCQPLKIKFRFINLPDAIYKMLESTSLKKAFPDLF